MDIRHIAGKENVVADALSRVESINKAIDQEELAKSQRTDEQLKQLINSDNGLQLQLIPVPGTSTSLYCDLKTGRPRPFVTEPFRKQVFQSLHGLSHPGVKATRKLIAQKFVWPEIQKDCADWTRGCIQCQKAKITRHNRAPVGNFQPTSTRFEHVHVDIVGPLPSSRGFKYCLTMIDRFSRWPEAVPIREITADIVARKIFETWMARFGMPVRITTDQGRQFEADLFQRLAQLTGTKHIRTTAYHPAANGMVERLHRQLKAAIKCHETERWTEILPVVLLGIRSAWKEDLQATSAEMVYGETIRLPGQFLNTTQAEQDTQNTDDFVGQLREFMRDLRPQETKRHGQPTPFVFKEMETTSHVFLRKDFLGGKLRPTYDGPHKVLRRDGKIFKLQINGKETDVSIDRLKPAFIMRDEEASTEKEKETTEPRRSTRISRPPVRFQCGF